MIFLAQPWYVRLAAYVALGLAARLAALVIGTALAGL